MPGVRPPVIRPYRPGDLESLYRVCLLTGDAGEDASDLYQDPRLLGQVYAAPYAALEPELAFVLEDEVGVSAYVLGALDTRAFEAELERRWWPALRERFPMPATPVAERRPDERLIALIHHPPRASDEVVAAHPSHLHVDLLPRAQGGGHGRRLMETLLERLSALGSPGVHLGVGARNTRAIGFYRHLGFRTLKEVPGALVLGRRLGDADPGKERR